MVQKRPPEGQCFCSCDECAVTGTHREPKEKAKSQEHGMWCNH